MRLHLFQPGAHREKSLNNKQKGHTKPETRNSLKKHKQNQNKTRFRACTGVAEKRMPERPRRVNEAITKEGGEEAGL